MKLRPRNKEQLILHIPRKIKFFAKRILIILVILFAIFIIFVSRLDSPFTRSLKLSLTDIVSPVLRVISMPLDFAINVNDSIISYFFVHRKNEELLSENRILQKKINRLLPIEIENKKLKELLLFVKERDYSYISARVVGDVSGPFNRYVLINVGAKNGVKKGQAVISDEGLIGRIMDVSEHSSRIMLVTDINSKVPVISELSRERSILAGNNTNKLELLYLSQENTIIAGEKIFTSGDGDYFPPGIQVAMVYSDDNKHYFAKPFTKWHKLEYVSIINYEEN